MAGMCSIADSSFDSMSGSWILEFVILACLTAQPCGFGDRKALLATAQVCTATLSARLVFN